MVQHRKGRKSPWMVQIRSGGSVNTHSFMRKEDAIAFERQEQRNRQLSKAGLEQPQSDLLFIDFAAGWLRKRSKGKQSSFKQDESRLNNYWLPKFGSYPLAAIRTAQIAEFLDHIQFELAHAPADRNRHRALLHKLFKDALMAGKVLHNPVSAIPLVKEKIRRKSGTLEPADQEAYIRAVYAQGEHYGILCDIMLWTGARIMAASALQWSDVDFKTGTVWLHRIIERASSSPQDRTKGGDEGGAEVVPLLPILRDRLNAWRDKSEYTRPTDFVAAVPGSGRFVTYEAYRDAHERALAATGITRFTPHAIKKAFATNAKRAGLTRTEIMELFGHSSEQVTAKYDLKDIRHLIERANALQFGASPVSTLSAKKGKKNRTSGGRS